MEYRFYYWGPLLLSMKLSDNDFNKVKLLCSKKNKFVNSTLVGVIKNEHNVDHIKYNEIIKPYLNNYKEVFKQYRNFKLNGDINCSSAWVNYMKQNEYNPPHTHDNCDLSSVLFISIPEKLKLENKKWRKNNTHYGGPGCISFYYGSPGFHNTECHEFFPEEKIIFIFPKDLKHWVSPFFSKCERVSLAANFKITD